jgi:GMP synthase (glutamine-hydrolysing)
VIQHQDDCPPALVGRWLVEAGCMLDTRRPYAGEPLPDNLADHDALMVLGGSMGAEDDAAHRWLAPTKELIRIAATSRVPALGICLGHQLAAVALGGRVDVNPHGREFGVLSMGWTAAAAADSVLGTMPSRAIHWNNDVVTELPSGAELLALAPDGAVQAARLAPTVWGVQPHPEVDDAIVALWAEDERDEIGADVTDVALAEMHRAGPDLQSMWRPVAVAFAHQVAARADPARVTGT